MFTHDKSISYYNEALQHIVGGVNSPARSYKAVTGGAPIVMERALGAYFWDIDGNRYIDYLGAYGPLINGHAHPKIVEAIKTASTKGILYGTPAPDELVFAKLIKEAIPSLDKIRFTNSGTEAVMSTIRVARAYTKRTKIIKFEGCYHGHFDAVLVAAGSGPATLGIPDSAGVPPSTASDVITIPYNDNATFLTTMQKWGSEIAAILVEPIVGNFGIVTPKENFLQTINDTAKHYGALVIYDEVVTGFRFMYGGAQDYLKIKPDLTALGKIIGGGLPIGAYGGRKDIMEQVAPLGPAYQAGTMAGNPLSMATGIACLNLLKEENPYSKLAELGSYLAEKIRSEARKYHIPIFVNQLGSAIAIYFTDQEITNYTDVKQSNTTQFATFFKLLTSQGIFLAPSKYEPLFISTAHTKQDLDITQGAIEYAFQKMEPK